MKFQIFFFFTIKINQKLYKYIYKENENIIIIKNVIKICYQIIWLWEINKIIQKDRILLEKWRKDNNEVICSKWFKESLLCKNKLITKFFCFAILL